MLFIVGRCLVKWNSSWYYINMNKLIETVISNNFYFIDENVTNVIREYLLSRDVEDFEYDPHENYNLIIGMIFEWLEKNNIEAR